MWELNYMCSVIITIVSTRPPIQRIPPTSGHFLTLCSLSAVGRFACSIYYSLFLFHAFWFLVFFVVTLHATSRLIPRNHTIFWSMQWWVDNMPPEQEGLCQICRLSSAKPHAHLDNIHPVQLLGYPIWCGWEYSGVDPGEVRMTIYNFCPADHCL